MALATAASIKIIAKSRAGLSLGACCERWSTDHVVMASATMIVDATLLAIRQPRPADS